LSQTKKLVNLIKFGLNKSYNYHILYK
jgi:hypothetical protein